MTHVMTSWPVLFTSLFYSDQFKFDMQTSRIVEIPSSRKVPTKQREFWIVALLD